MTNAARPIVVTDWVTVRSGPSMSLVTQSEWRELPGYADATFWIDVEETRRRFTAKEGKRR